MSLELRRDGHPHQALWIVHLLSRSVSDLLAGGHLAAHCYISQEYSVLRPVLDSFDLIDLFAKDPEEATNWATTASAHRDFSPGAVRKRLGRDKHDPVHGHFSESGSHPRFAGARLSGGMQVSVDDPEDQTATLLIGPLWREHNATLMIWPLAFQSALQLSFAGHHLVSYAVDAEAANVSWLRAYLTSLDAGIAGFGHVLDLLDESPDSPMRTAFADARASVVAQLDVRRG